MASKEVLPSDILDMPIKFMLFNIEFELVLRLVHTRRVGAEERALGQTFHRAALCWEVDVDRS